MSVSFYSIFYLNYVIFTFSLPFYLTLVIFCSFNFFCIFQVSFHHFLHYKMNVSFSLIFSLLFIWFVRGGSFPYCLFFYERCLAIYLENLAQENLAQENKESCRLIVHLGFTGTLAPQGSLLPVIHLCEDKSKALLDCDFVQKCGGIIFCCLGPSLCLLDINQNSLDVLLVMP